MTQHVQVHLQVDTDDRGRSLPPWPFFTFHESDGRFSARMFMGAVCRQPPEYVVWAEARLDELIGDGMERHAAMAIVRTEAINAPWKETPKEGEPS